MTSDVCLPTYRPNTAISREKILMQYLDTVKPFSAIKLTCQI